MTRLEAILMGLLAERPRTGYEMLQVIAKSPSFGIQATAGSVYPALRRLTDAEYIRAEDVSIGARPASSYHLTPAGESALDRWLREPVSAGTAADTEEVLLRVLFSDRLPTDELRTKLLAYREAMGNQVAALESLAPFWAELPIRQRLCLENGLRSARTQLEWADWSLNQLSDEEAGEP